MRDHVCKFDEYGCEQPGCPDNGLTGPAKPAPTPELIPVILHCPKCNFQHVDRDEWATTARPHRSHLCEMCKNIWRPYESAYTVGVEYPVEGLTDKLNEAKMSADHYGNLYVDACNHMDRIAKEREALRGLLVKARSHIRCFRDCRFYGEASCSCGEVLAAEVDAALGTKR